MAQFEAFDDGVDVDGQTTRSTLAGGTELSGVFETFGSTGELVELDEEGDLSRSDGGNERIYRNSWQ